MARRMRAGSVFDDASARRTRAGSIPEEAALRRTQAGGALEDAEERELEAALFGASPEQLENFQAKIAEAKEMDINDHLAAI